MSEELNSTADRLELVIKALPLPHAAALEPFAKAGALVPPNTLDEMGRERCPDSTIIITLGNAPGPYFTLTYGHLRAAARAMEGP